MKMDQKGYILVLSMVMLIVVTVMGMALAQMGIFEMRLAGNDLQGKQAFWLAEGGWQEAKARFGSNNIVDSDLTSVSWRLYLSDTMDRAKLIGYDSGNPNHILVSSSAPNMQFAVEVRKKVDGEGKIITIANNPVYVAVAHGYREQSYKIVEVEFVKTPSLDGVAALYSKTNVSVRGASTYIQGNDVCGSVSKPGIFTGGSTINQNGNPIIDGLPATVTYGETVPLADQLDLLKDYANFKYSYMDNATVTGADWGTLTGGGNTTTPLQPTLSEPNVVFFDMNDVNTLKLSGGCHGQGILLVKGNLMITGGFSWYGIIIVTGSLDYTGGGEKNITGSVMAGGGQNVETDISGNAGIMYCSSVKDYLKKKIPTMKVLKWQEVTR